MKNKTLWLMIGIPASGKSTFAREVLMENHETWAYISRDEIRFENIDQNAEYFSKENEVFNQFVEEIQNALDCGEFHDVIADATHLHEPSRLKLLCHLKLDKVNVIPVVIQTPLSTCIERNAMRNGRARVPDKVIKSMFKSLTHPSTDAYNYKMILEVSG